MEFNILRFEADENGNFDEIKISRIVTQYILKYFSYGIEEEIVVRNLPIEEIILPVYDDINLELRKSFVRRF